MKCIRLSAMLCVFAFGAAADEVIHTVSPATLKTHLEKQGYEVFAHEDENDQPQVLVRPIGEQAAAGVEERVGFAMRLTGCGPDEIPFYDRACDGFEYHAYLTPGFPINDKVYDAWNSDFGHSRAYVKDNHPRLAWRVSLEGGVTWDHINATVVIWRAELAAFLEHLDASMLD